MKPPRRRGRKVAGGDWRPLSYYPELKARGSEIHRAFSWMAHGARHMMGARKGCGQWAGVGACHSPGRTENWKEVMCHLGVQGDSFVSGRGAGYCLCRAPHLCDVV